LAVAPDVSHLSEIPFHRYGHFNSWQLKSLADERILVLKKPSWPGEKDYPSVPPVGDHRIVLLIRHPYEALVSTGKMYEKLESDFWNRWSYKSMLYDYWLPTYEGMIAKGIPDLPNSTTIRYEDLTAYPREETKRLFKFIQSSRVDGTDTYARPSKSWAYMQDDGSPLIKSLKVQTRTSQRMNHDLLKMINDEPRVMALLKRLGYE
jgi:hypothetical protein